MELDKCFQAGSSSAALRTSSHNALSAYRNEHVVTATTKLFQQPTEIGGCSASPAPNVALQEHADVAGYGTPLDLALFLRASSSDTGRRMFSATDLGSISNCMGLMSLHVVGGQFSADHEVFCSLV